MHQFTSKQDFCHWFNQFQHPQLVENWADIHGAISITTQGSIDITLPFASNELQTVLHDWIKQQQASGKVAEFPFNIRLGVKALETQVANSVKGVKNIIAVSSAKGGVGKSTTAVNLALAIAQSGAKVGLLDADIYGPSVPMMLGQEDAKPEVRDGKWMEPIFAHGI
ncbi:P-loop NTPase, partial [Vibrio parahaemolyticus]|nr:P-loop NTPase [Vibrio parahaemolyticus]